MRRGWWRSRKRKKRWHLGDLSSFLFNVAESFANTKSEVKVPRNQEQDKDAALLLPSMSALQKDLVLITFIEWPVSDCDQAERGGDIQLFCSRATFSGRRPSFPSAVILIM